MIGGTKTSRDSREIGAADTKASRLKIRAPKKSESAEESDLVCIIVDEMVCSGVREVVNVKWFVTRSSDEDVKASGCCVKVVYGKTKSGGAVKRGVPLYTDERR